MRWYVIIRLPYVIEVIKLDKMFILLCEARKTYLTFTRTYSTVDLLIIGQLHIESESHRNMSPPWFSLSLRNICASNDHGYVPFVVIIIHVLSSFMTYHRVYNKSNTTNATSGAGTACPLRAPEYITILLGYCVFCHSRYLVSDCLFGIFKFFSTFGNI